MTNTVEAVVFDLDGVLLASEGQWDEVRRAAAVVRSLDEISPELVASAAGRGQGGGAGERTS